MDDIICDNAEINIIGISVCRQNILQARKILLAQGINANIINLLWLKPLNLEHINKYFSHVKIGLIVDPSYELCGASEAVAYQLMKNNIGSFIDTLGIEDRIKTTNPHNWNEVPTVDMIVKKVHDILNSFRHAL